MTPPQKVQKKQSIPSTDKFWLQRNSVLYFYIIGINACWFFSPPKSTFLRILRSLYFFFFFLNLFIIFLFMSVLVFISVRGLSLVAASGGHSSSRCAGLSLSRPLLLRRQAPDAQAQQLWLTGPVALRHVGSSQTRAQTHVPCIGRQILNQCATREAQLYFCFLIKM